MQNVSKPIIIDQYYCDSPVPCQNQVPFLLQLLYYSVLSSLKIVLCLQCRHLQWVSTASPSEASEAHQQQKKLSYCYAVKPIHAKDYIWKIFNSFHFPGFQNRGAGKHMAQPQVSYIRLLAFHLIKVSLNTMISTPTQQASGTMITLSSKHIQAIYGQMGYLGAVVLASSECIFATARSYSFATTICVSFANIAYFVQKSWNIINVISSSLSVVIDVQNRWYDECCDNHQRLHWCNINVQNLCFWCNWYLFQITLVFFIGVHLDWMTRFSLKINVVGCLTRV